MKCQRVCVKDSVLQRVGSVCVFVCWWSRGCAGVGSRRVPGFPPNESGISRPPLCPLSTGLPRELGPGASLISTILLSLLFNNSWITTTRQNEKGRLRKWLHKCGYIFCNVFSIVLYYILTAHLYTCISMWQKTFIAVKNLRCGQWNEGKMLSFFRSWNSFNLSVGLCHWLKGMVTNISLEKIQ